MPRYCTFEQNITHKKTFKSKMFYGWLALCDPDLSFIMITLIVNTIVILHQLIYINPTMLTTLNLKNECLSISIVIKKY